MNTKGSGEFATWDVDCEQAFEVALPPRWEFRDRAFGSPGIWRPFNEAVSCEINALVRRGQRRGNVSISGAEFAVDLQDMVAMPTDQYAVPRGLRKNVRQPNVNKKALRAACNAAEMGVFRRREFICGCAALEVDNIADLRGKMPELRDNVISGKSLPEVYAYTFGVALEPPCKLLPLEEAGAVPNKVQTIVACLLEAAQYWALLLPNWPLREDFCDWAMRHMKGKAINRDLWMMILKLATEVPADLSNFNENPAWPVVLDDFVEYYRAQKGLHCNRLLTDGQHAPMQQFEAALRRWFRQQHEAFGELDADLGCEAFLLQSIQSLPREV
eukprot:g3068.t1